jgi:hypothetical protein
MSNGTGRMSLYSGWTHYAARVVFGVNAGGFIIAGISFGWSRFHENATHGAFLILVGVLVAFTFLRPLRPVWWDGDFRVAGRGPWARRIHWLDVGLARWPWWVTVARNRTLGGRLTPYPMELPLRHGGSILFFPRYNAEYLILQAKQEARARAGEEEAVD